MLILRNYRNCITSCRLDHSFRFAKVFPVVKEASAGVDLPARGGSRSGFLSPVLARLALRRPLWAFLPPPASGSLQAVLAPDGPVWGLWG